MKYYKIGELANLLTLSPRTIRYYEEIGLLNSIRRIEGGKRVYTDQDYQRLKFILELLESHVEKIEERIRNLEKLKSEILTYDERIREKLDEGT